MLNKYTVSGGLGSLAVVCSLLLQGSSGLRIKPCRFSQPFPPTPQLLLWVTPGKDKDIVEANFEPNTGPNLKSAHSCHPLCSDRLVLAKITPWFPDSVFPDVKIHSHFSNGKCPLLGKYPQRGEKPRPCHSRKGLGLSRTLGLPRPRGIEFGDPEGGSGCLELPARRERPVTLRDLGQGLFFPPNPASQLSEEGSVARAVPAGRGRPHARRHQFPFQPPSSSPGSTSGSGRAGAAAAWGRSGLPANLPGGSSGGWDDDRDPGRPAAPAPALPDRPRPGPAAPHRPGPVPPAQP